MNAQLPLQECVRCILSTADTATLTFDANGVCNYCTEFDRRWRRLPHTDSERTIALDKIVAEIKGRGKGRTYDCIVGLSGGVDSSYLVYVAAKMGLRPLVVHCDNGWNTEAAVQNIERVVRKLGLDLRTFVINWEDFRDMQLAYLRASVIDIEVLTDHAIFGALFRIALEEKIGFILSGANEATEGILPSDWVFDKRDHVNILAIHREFGQLPARGFPYITYALRRRIGRARIKVIPLLDIVPYQKTEAKAIISTELGWRDYGGKHNESLWTRFYQGYILPTKFKVDKRRAHLASLIVSGQMTRDEARDVLSKPTYAGDALRDDMAFVLKKLGLTTKEFDSLMSQAPRKHKDFRTADPVHPFLTPFRPLWRVFKRQTGLDRNRIRSFIRSRS